jgi:16S rRNA (guanine966-N2)-methyltransferase
MLGDVSGARVLDLFAGSGALGIEALSRGAASALFVESDARAAATIRGNLDALGAEGEVRRQDALRFLAEAPHRHVPFDLVLCDPPYDLAPSLAGQLAEHLPAVTSEDARIVIESDKRRPLLLPLPTLRERIYGDTRIAIHGR